MRVGEPPVFPGRGNIYSGAESPGALSGWVPHLTLEGGSQPAGRNLCWPDWELCEGELTAPRTGHLSSVAPPPSCSQLSYSPFLVSSCLPRRFPLQRRLRHSWWRQRRDFPPPRPSGFSSDWPELFPPGQLLAGRDLCFSWCPGGRTRAGAGSARAFSRSQTVSSSLPSWTKLRGFAWPSTARQGFMFVFVWCFTFNSHLRITDNNCTAVRNIPSIHCAMTGQRWLIIYLLTKLNLNNIIGCAHHINT